MEKPTIAYCGLNCSLCKAFLATQKNDDELRRKVAQEWSITPEKINCYDCLTEEKPRISYTQTCTIRSCSKERKLINCAHCDDYACDKLAEFHKRAPNAKTNLDEIRTRLGK